MSERLDKELAKLKYAKVQKMEDNKYIIKKDTQIRVEENNCYLIELHNTIFDPNSILCSNWNNGRVPKCRYYLIDVNKMMANMIRVSGVGYNEIECTNMLDNWYGWLPLSEIDVIKKV